ncbi:rhombosortase [bacterium]|nr:rhombosortase [bacterium]
MKNQPRHIPYLTLVIALAAVTIQFFPSLAGFLAFDRATILSGRLYPLWSGHLTHWSWNHLGWDLIVFVALAGYCELRNRRRLLFLFAAAPPAISLAVFIGSPHLAAYRGLSGLDSALFALVLGGFDRSSRKIHAECPRTIVLIAAAAFLAKLIYETATGATLFAAPSAEYLVVPSAHLAGFICGLWVSTLPPRRVARSSSFKIPFFRIPPRLGA